MGHLNKSFQMFKLCLIKRLKDITQIIVSNTLETIFTAIRYGFKDLYSKIKGKFWIRDY